MYQKLQEVSFMQPRLTNTEVLIVPGEMIGFPGEYLRVWATKEKYTKEDERYTDFKISGFGRDRDDKPTDSDDVYRIVDVLPEHRDDVRHRLSEMHPLGIENIGYWRLYKDEKESR